MDQHYIATLWKKAFRFFFPARNRHCGLKNGNCPCHLMSWQTWCLHGGWAGTRYNNAVLRTTLLSQGVYWGVQITPLLTQLETVPWMLGQHDLKQGFPVVKCQRSLIFEQVRHPEPHSNLTPDVPVNMPSVMGFLRVSIKMFKPREKSLSLSVWGNCFITRTRIWQPFSWQSAEKKSLIFSHTCSTLNSRWAREHGVDIHTYST